MEKVKARIRDATAELKATAVWEPNADWILSELKTKALLTDKADVEVEVTDEFAECRRGIYIAEVVLKPMLQSS